MPLAKPHPLDDLRLIPKPIEAKWPADATTRAGRQFSGKLGTVINRLAEILDEVPWLAEAEYTARNGSLATELRGALGVLRQAHVSLDSALDQALLEKRQTLAAQGRAAQIMKRRIDSLIGEQGNDD